MGYLWFLRKNILSTALEVRIPWRPVVRYNIYICRNCGAVCAGREGASSFTCCFCGRRSSTEKAIPVVKGVESKDVQRLVAQLKLSRVKVEK